MKIVGLSAKLSDMIVKTALYISRWSFWRKCIRFNVRNCLMFAEFGMKLFSPFAKFFSRCEEAAFYVFTDAFWKNILFYTKVCFIFFGNSGKVRTSWWTSFDRIAKAIFYVSKNWAKQMFFCKVLFLSFLETQLKSFCRLEKYPRQFSQNRILGVQRNFLMAVNVSKKKIYSNFCIEL